MNTEIVPLIAERHLGARYFIEAPRIKCVTFVCMMYHEAGLSSDFSLQPVIMNTNDMEKEESVGKIVFLMNKRREFPLFSHLAIVYDYQSVIHYSRHAAPDKIRRVIMSSFSELLGIYKIVQNPYNKSVS